MLKTASAAIALLALANPALAASCADPVEAAALKTAVIQQELMVAALQCHETSAYNRFVMSYRGELQSSDAALKAFFVRRGGEHGEAGYDTFKTKAANLSALEQARHAGAFCADAHALFAAAFAHQGSLMSFVDSRAGQTDIGGICAESRPVLARSESQPPIAAPTVKVVAADVAVGGVPAHSLPAIPYGHEDRAGPPVRDSRAETAVARDNRDDRVGLRDSRTEAAVARDNDEDVSPADTDEEDFPPPPRRWRYSDVRERSYDGYAPRSYGPPPNWRQGWGQPAWRDYPPPPPPPPSYRWYGRDW